MWSKTMYDCEWTDSDSIDSDPNPLLLPLTGISSRKYQWQKEKELASLKQN